MMSRYSRSAMHKLGNRDWSHSHWPVFFERSSAFLFEPTFTHKIRDESFIDFACSFCLRSVHVPGHETFQGFDNEAGISD